MVLNGSEIWYTVRGQHAINHEACGILAYVLIDHKNATFCKFNALLVLCGITQWNNDDWGADSRHIESEVYTVGEANIQSVDWKHLTLCTRIKR